MHKWFITGTDTDVGKTYVGQQLMLGLAEQHYKTLGYKPISAGCEWIDGQLQNDDARHYRDNSTIKVALSEVNPIAYEPPIAPHIAAQQQGNILTLNAIEQGFNTLAQYQPDIIVTEGAGGWRLPLGNNVYLSEFPVQLSMQVILVVGLKLGCLNHAILTAQAIVQDGAQFAGWIGNQIDPAMLNQQENIAALTEHLGKPLGIIPAHTSLTRMDRKRLLQQILPELQ